jgi:hypothetical protein
MTEPPHPPPHGAPPSWSQYGVPPGSPYWDGAPPAGRGQPAAPDDPLVSTDYAGWWSRSTALARRAWPALLTLQLFGAVASVLIQAPVVSFLALAASGSGSLDGTAEMDLASGLVWIVAGIGWSIAQIPLQLLVYALVVLASVYVVVGAASSGPQDVGSALRGALRRVLPMTGWALVSGLLVVVGVLACLLPGLYLGLVFLLLPPVVAFERAGVFERCFQLFHGDLGAALARILTIGGLTVVAAIVAMIVESAVGLSPTDTAGTAGEVVLQAVGSLAVSAAVGAVAGVLIAPMAVVAYADLRARREPVSTPQLAAELAR